VELGPLWEIIRPYYITPFSIAHKGKSLSANYQIFLRRAVVISGFLPIQAKRQTAPQRQAVPRKRREK
jgi:hypothetical protein